MKKRNKFLIGLGIAGILGLGYYFLPRDNSTNKAENQSAEVSEAGAAKGSKKARKIIPKININSGFQEEKDEFRDYINNLELVPPILYKTDEKCDEKELREAKDEHKQLSTLLENWDKFPKPKRGHGIWPVVDTLIKIDTKLANCLYNGGDEGYKKTLSEMIQHLERNKRYAGAGSLQHYLGNEDQAREYFKKDEDTIEALIKLTPAEELPALGDKFIADKRYLEAGKIEWYQSNKERARQIIEQSEEFNEALKAAKESLKKREYEEAIDHLWMDSRIPFFRDIIKNLCGENKDCLDKLKEYNTSENVPVMLF